MLVLFAHPEAQPDEARVISRMLERHPELVFHLRKPDWKPTAFEELLQAIAPDVHPQIVLHQHHALADHYNVKGVHFTTAHRATENIHPTVISTSFHSLQEALEQGAAYRYFFCSPVFPSISKSGYSSPENWDIKSTSEAFREQAVALGGIAPTTLPQAREKGFHHFAVLGAVWETTHPEEALNELLAIAH